MITKNLIVNQLPEYRSSGQKPIRGLVSINLGAQTTGSIKVFNVDEKLLPLSVAIKIGEQKFVFDDVTTPQDYTFSLPKMDENAQILLLLASTNANNRAVEGLALAQSPDSDADYSELFEEFSDKELDELIDEEIARTAPDFVANSGVQQKIEDEVTVRDEINEIAIEPSGNFYSLIQPQLDELFSKFPHFAELEDLVANTEWVKVNYAPNESQHYILGKLYDGAIVTHLCYGIPASSRSSAPPEGLIDYCQWLPIDLNNVDGAGYWVMYQSAETGENVRL